MKPGGLKSFIESRRIELVCLALAAATCVVYGQVARFEFTNFDEFMMILQNPYVQGGLTRQGVWWGLTTSWFEYWHPVTWWSHMLDCELFGLNAGGHHLASLGFHVANTLLLFVVLRRMTGALWRSAMVAALFALHPLHVESVAWIAERKDVLSGFFFMLALWAYVRYAEQNSLESRVQSLKSEVHCQAAEGASRHCRRSADLQSALGERRPADSFWPHEHSKPTTSRRSGFGRFGDGGSIKMRPAADVQGSGRPVHRAIFHRPSTIFYLLALAMFALGLMSKPMVVTLPFVLLLLDYWPLSRLQPSTINYQLSTLRHLVWEKLPFFVLTIVSCAITYLSAKAGGNILSAEKVPWGLRLANVPLSYVRYLGKMIWPTGLIPLYPMPAQWAWWLVGGAVAVLVLISLWVVLRARSAPYLVVGWLLFLGMLLPTIGLVQVGFQSIADRYTYIPSIGIFMAVVWAAADWAAANHRWTQMNTDQKPRKPGLVTGSVHSPEGNAGQTQPQAESGPQNLGSSVSICGSALLGGVAAVVLVACGYLTWAQVGTWRNGYTLWSHCLAVDPDNVAAHYNLGYVFQHSNRTSEAIEQYRAVLRLKPDHLDGNLNLGIVLIASKQAQEAANYLAAAVRLKPDYAKAQNALGLSLLELGDYAGAVARCAEAIRLDPADFGSHVNMGRALSAQGKSDDALLYYSEGLRLQPAIPQTHYYLGLEWMKRGAYDQAAASFGEAVRLAPTFAEARAQQQRALDEAGKPQINTDSHR